MKNYRLFLPGLTFAIGPVLSYLSLPFITKNVSISDYGIYTYYLSLLSIISFLSLLPALNSTVNRYGSKRSESYLNDLYIVKKLYYVAFFIYTSCVVIAYFFNDTVLSDFEFVVISASIFSVNMFNAIKSYLLINNDKAKYTTFVIIINVVQYSYLFYAINSDDFSISDILFGNLLLILFVIFYKIKSLFEVIRIVPIGNAHNSKLIKFLGMSVAISLSTIIFNNTDKIMLEHLLDDPRSLALYQVSYQIFSFPIESIYSLISIFTPAFLYRAFDKDRELYLRNLRITFKLVLFLTFVISQFLIVNENYLKSLLLDSSYIVSDSLPVLFLISQSIFLLYLIVTNIFIVYDKRFYIIVSLSIASIINMFLNWFLVSSLGYIGAAISTLIAYLILMIIMLIICYRLFDVNFFGRDDVILVLSTPLAFYLFGDSYIAWTLSLSLVSILYFSKNIGKSYLGFLRGV